MYFSLHLRYQKINAKSYIKCRFSYVRFLSITWKIVSYLCVRLSTTITIITTTTTTLLPSPLPRLAKDNGKLYHACHNVHFSMCVATI